MLKEACAFNIIIYHSDMTKPQIFGMKEEFVKNLPQDIDICLLGLQGSRMLGLQQTADADYDYRGVFVAKNSDLLSFSHIPKGTIEGGSYGDDEMEYVFHEVEKFFRLGIKCNPSVIHLFFVPKYNIKTDIGDMIVKNKNLFLNEEGVRSAFGGYALGQMLYLQRNRGDAKRREKHVRHCFRLLETGMELLTTGHINLPLPYAQHVIDLGKKINEEDGLVYIIKLFEEKDAEFKAAKSVLPKAPEEYLIDKLLLKIRNV